MPIQPGPHLGVFVAAVIVEDDVDDLAGRDLSLDRVQKADELLMPVPLHAAADDLAFEHVEGGKQRGRAVALVVMRHRPATARFQRQARLRAVERLDLRFLVNAEHDRMGRRMDIEADNVPQLRYKIGVARQLELACPVRLDTCARQIRCTELTLIPTALAIIAAVQCVVSPGGAPRVNATVRSHTLADNGGMREGRVLSRTRPATPARMNRSCQRHTVTLLVPVRRMISLVPTPSPVSTTICARQTCFCGLFRSTTIASRRALSAALISRVTPLRTLAPLPPSEHTYTYRDSFVRPYPLVYTTGGIRAARWDHARYHSHYSGGTPVP